jgi:hypothetical protein
MKKFLAVTLFAFGTFALVSCGGSDSGSTHCEDGNNPDCNYKVCANEGGSAWYEYEGKKYNCKGSKQNVDCSDAVNELFQACGLF